MRGCRASSEEDVMERLVWGSARSDGVVVGEWLDGSIVGVAGLKAVMIRPPMNDSPLHDIRAVDRRIGLPGG